MANGIYVAAINRVGFESDRDGGLEFWGASFVSDPINLTTDANGQVYVNNYFITLASGTPAGNYYIGAFSNGGVYGMGRSCFGPLSVSP